MVISIMYWLFCVVFLFLSVGTSQGQTYNDDYSLMTEINRQRLLNNTDSLVINHNLQQAARTLIQNHAYFLCDEQHKNCQGEGTKRRLSRFYPDYLNISEIYGVGFDVQSIVQGFINSPDRPILFGNHQEFGGALLSRQYPFGYIGEAVVNFGTRMIYPDGTPVISGAVYDGFAWMTYDASKPPKAAFVTLGKKDYSLKLFEGKPNRGIYRIPIKMPRGCEEIKFTVLSDYDIPIVFPNPLWKNLIGDLCFDSPILLNKVRLRINSSGNRLFRGTLSFNLEMPPNQNPKNIVITYGKNGVIRLPTEPFLKHTSTSTKLRGNYKAAMGKAEPGIVNIYLDYKLVASMYPKFIQQNYIEVRR